MVVPYLVKVCDVVDNLRVVRNNRVELFKGLERVTRQPQVDVYQPQVKDGLHAVHLSGGYNHIWSYTLSGYALCRCLQTPSKDNTVKPPRTTPCILYMLPTQRSQQPCAEGTIEVTWLNGDNLRSSGGVQTGCTAQLHSPLAANGTVE